MGSSNRYSPDSDVGDEVSSGLYSRRREGVLEVVLANPARGNAITHEWVSALKATLAAVDEADRCLLIRAEGKNFCVGGDISAFGNGTSENLVPGLVAHLHSCLKVMYGLSIPIVSAVQGAAAGAGFGVACSADIIVCADDARFKSAYNQLGLTPDGGLTWLLPRAVALPLAFDLLLTDRVLLAEEAERHGLVSRVVPAHELTAAATNIATAIAQGPRDATMRVKSLARRSHGNSLWQHLDEETAALSTASASVEGREGVTAFIERRPARFIDSAAAGAQVSDPDS